MEKSLEHLWNTWNTYSVSKARFGLLEHLWSTSSINTRKYRGVPGTWHVSPERGLTEQIHLFYRGRPAAALQRCTRCTRSTGCSAAAAAAPAAALLLQLAARRCCCSSLLLQLAATRSTAPNIFLNKNSIFQGWIGFQRQPIHPDPADPPPGGFLSPL